jgi:preprotein translocase subunit SecG
MSILTTILLVINLIVSVLLILLTLMQRPKNEGLGAAFGGGMTENLFGADTSNVLSTATRWLGGAFFALTLVLSMLYARNVTTKSDIERELINKPKPVASATPAASPTSADAAAKQKVLDSVKQAIQEAGQSGTAAGASAPVTPVVPAASAISPAASAAPTAKP